MAYEYESTEARTLKAIQSKNYPDTNKDFVKNISRLNSSVDYISSYMGVMQKGIDDANQNIIEQIQGFFQDIWVLFAGGEPTGFDIGDVKYVFMALGALFGFSGKPFPYNVIDMVQHMFDNFLSFLPQFTDVIFDTIFAWMDALGAPSDLTGALRDAYENAIQALAKADNIIEALAGIGGGISDMMGNIAAFIYEEFIQPIINFISRAVGGPIGGAIDSILTNIARIFGLASGADTKATLLYKAAKPLWETLDGNGETSLLLSTADTLMNITASASRGGFIMCRGGDEIRTISCVGSKSGTVNTFNIDIYALNSANGIDFVYSSPDLQASLIAGVNTVLFFEIPETDGFTTNTNAWYVVIARMTGSGSVNLQGRIYPEADTPSRPLYPGILRNPTTTPVPANIPQGTLDTIYVRETPYFQIGTIAGILPQSFFDDFTTLSDNFWIRKRAFSSGLGEVRNLVASDGRLYLPSGGANGFSAITRKFGCATSKCRVGVCLRTDPTNNKLRVTMFSKLTMSSSVVMSIESGGAPGSNPIIEIATSDGINSYSGAYDGFFVSYERLKAGAWVYLEYDPSDNKYRIYIDPDWSSADLRNTSLPLEERMLFREYDPTGFAIDAIDKGSISRSSSIILVQTSGGVKSAEVDDWILEDWSEVTV